MNIKLILTTLIIIGSLEVKAQNCGVFYLFNFQDTVVDDPIWPGAKNGFSFDFTYDTLTAPNTGYINFNFVTDLGDTITTNDLLPWGRFFPFSSIDTLKYVMILDSSLSSFPQDFKGHLSTKNPECQIPVDLTLTSINENQLDQVIIFPNPSKDILHIQSQMKFQSISIFDNLGKKYSADIFGKTVDISNLIPGSYYIEMKSMNYKIIKKFAKD